MCLVDEELLIIRVERVSVEVFPVVDDVAGVHIPPIVCSSVAGSLQPAAQYLFHPLQVPGRLFRFQHEHSAAIFVLEVEVHPERTDPNAMLIARPHQFAGDDQPLVTGKATDVDGGHPADAFAIQQLFSLDQAHSAA